MFGERPFIRRRILSRQPTDMSLTLAVAFAGHMMIELIEQHDDKPSVYRDDQDQGAWLPSLGDLLESFDQDVAAYEGADYPSRSRIFRRVVCASSTSTPAVTSRHA